MYHNTIKRSMLPLGAEHSSSPSLPAFLSISASLNLSGESVYPQSVGIVQLLRKCTKCFLLLFCWAFSIYRRNGELYRKPLCSPLKMSTWIWSSCIANNYKCGPGAEACTHTQSDAHIYSETGKALPTVLNQCWGFTVHDWVHLTLLCLVWANVQNISSSCSITPWVFNILRRAAWKTSPILRHAHSSSLTPCNWCLWCF